MSQGDFVKINSTTEVDAKVQHLQKRLRDWDYQSPCCVRLTAYRNPASMDQVALFNMWCREIAQAMKKRTPKADAEAWKLWLKRKFLGTDTHQVGKDIIEQVKPTPKGKAEMCKFMSSVLVFADEKLHVRLGIPKNSEYANESQKAKQKAKATLDQQGSGKGSSVTTEAGENESSQQQGLF
jgi:hypothetical protein